ncbi:MAG: SRPBCC family protein [Candidatus Eremiobacteraeota bacterium]|nr:SRPBCC family protein [Candidatus Eremiobacteraeota bacterium]
MATYGKSRETTATPERVWSVWSDPNNWTRWNSGIKAARLDGPLVSGAKGSMTTSHGSTHEVTFTNVEPPRRFRMNMDGPPLTSFAFICEVTPNGSGSTIAQSVAISGPLAFLFGPLMGAKMADHFIPVLDDLASAAETA